MVETDGYFNSLTFDEAVTAIVNVLLLMGGLYIQHQPRKDEGGAGNRFSTLSGVHSMGWKPDAWARYVQDFNSIVERVVVANQKVKTRQEAGRLSKDKTRRMEFCPSVGLLEKTIEYLSADSCSEVLAWATPEELVRMLASVNIDQVLAEFEAERIGGCVSPASVKVSDAWATWYSTQYGVCERAI